MRILKNFIVFEGGDGSGTTTQIKMLANTLASRQNSSDISFYTTFEPTDGSVGRLIRSALRNEITLMPAVIAHLFAADRFEHLYGPNGIEERCLRGEAVICDRYTPSSLVYQGISCDETLPALLNKDFPGPELLIFLDVDPEIAQNRMENRGKKEIYENLDFQILVRQRYKALLPRFSAEGMQVIEIDASGTPEEIAFEAWSHIKKLPIFNR